MNNLKVMKSSLRKTLRERRKHFVQSLSDEQYRLICKSVSLNLKQQLQNIVDTFPENEITIAGFYPVNSELNCLEIMKHMQSQYRFCLPIHFANEDQKPLFFREFNTKTQLVMGEYDIPIPSPSSAIAHPNIILTPFLGFDPITLHRIGYGGGHFDRTIKHFQNKQSLSFSILFSLFQSQSKIPYQFIGLGFDCQKIDQLISDENDQPLNSIITETAIYSSLLR